MSYPKVSYDPSEIQTLKDPSGNGYDVIEFNGMYMMTHFTETGFCPGYKTNLPRIKDMDIREDDVLMCAYPKAGTQWLSEIILMLKKGKPEYEAFPKAINELEFQSVEHLDKLPSPRVLNTHLLFRHLPNKVIDQGIKVIFLQRNPKDVAVSMLHHVRGIPIDYNPEWKDFFHHFLSEKVAFAQYTTYANDWESNLKCIAEENILLTYFEDIKVDPISEITRIAKFLGANSDEAFIKQVAEQCDFKTMKEGKTRPVGDDTVDYTRKITAFLYRKGEIGDWKNYFTVAQNEEFDAFLEQAMGKSSFKYKYTS